MGAVVSTSLCLLAWVITLVRGSLVWRKRLWKTDPQPFRVWVAAFFFSVTMTFLSTPISTIFNRLTFSNFSRLLAYSSVSVTLFLLASHSLIAFPVTYVHRLKGLLKWYFMTTLGLLTGIYILFISNMPEWGEEAVPTTGPEMAFRLVLFAFAFISCLILAVAYYLFTRQEKVAATRFRVATILATSVSAGAFFLTKTVLVLGYLWPPLGADWIHSVAKLLEVGTVLLWSADFLHNNVYARVLSFLRGLRDWFIYQDLITLTKSLELVCPPVGMTLNKADFREFVKNSDYHLYRAVVHILDGQTLIADFLANPDPENTVLAHWGEAGYRRAKRLNEFLEEIHLTDNFEEIIREYRLAGRQIAGAFE